MPHESSKSPQDRPASSPRGRLFGGRKPPPPSAPPGRVPINAPPLPPKALSGSIGWIAEFRAGCHGRNWLLPLAIWIYLAHVGYQQFEDPVNYNSLFGAINLGIHEGGHILFRPFGEWLHIAGGTIAQLSAPIIAMGILGRQRDYFGITFCLGWLSTNLIGVGVYMADARARELPLVSAEGAGSDPGAIIHDWAYLFGQAGLLDDDTTIGLATRGLGTATMALALIAGAWIIWEMSRPKAVNFDPTAERREIMKRRAKF